MTDVELSAILEKLRNSKDRLEAYTHLKELITLLRDQVEIDQSNEPEHMTLEEYVAYIKATEGHGSMKAFAERCGMISKSIVRILSGEHPKLRLDTMLKIQNASGGRVSRVDDFVITRPRKKQGRPGRPKSS